MYVTCCRFEPSWAKVISGIDEGIYGWIALNYLTGHLVSNAGQDEDVETSRLDGERVHHLFYPDCFRTTCPRVKPYWLSWPCSSHGSLGMGHWAWVTGHGSLGMGHWAWVTGHGSLGMGHWAEPYSAPAGSRVKPHVAPKGSLLTVVFVLCAQKPLCTPKPCFCCSSNRGQP